MNKSFKHLKNVLFSIKMNYHACQVGLVLEDSIIGDFIVSR